jgi:hypothetical protein
MLTIYNRIILLLVTTLTLSCSKEKENSSCWGKLIQEGDNFIISKETLCYYWSGYEYLHLQIREAGSEKIIEKPIDYNNSCIDFIFDLNKKYTLLVFYGCYLDGNYSLKFHKTYEF